MTHPQDKSAGAPNSEASKREGVITKPEWIKRYAARIQERSGSDREFAEDAARIGAEVYEQQERGCGNAVVWWGGPSGADNTPEADEFLPMGALAPSTDPKADPSWDQAQAAGSMIARWQAERLRDQAAPKADLLRRMAETLETAREYVVEGKRWDHPDYEYDVASIDQLLKEARQ